MTGGILTLTATLATSMLTALMGSRRQKLDLAHARSLEREKLLYEQRISLYLEIQEPVDELESDMTFLRAQRRAVPLSVKLDGDHVRELVERLEGYLTMVSVISDEEVANAFLRYWRTARAELWSVLQGDLDAHTEPYGIDNRSVPKRIRLKIELLGAIRNEIGSRTFELTA